MDIIPTVLIADDEPLARAHVVRLLAAQNIKVAGQAANGIEALEMAAELQPDIVLLDIQMPGLTGMKLASALVHMAKPPLIIFITGYADHAVSAFDAGAIDYLLKPITSERLCVALERATQRLSRQEPRTEAVEAISAQAAREPLKRLPIREDYSIHLLKPEEILFVVSRNRKVIVRTAAREYRTAYTLAQLEAILPSELFVRVHESALINLEHAEELVLLGNHSYVVRMSDSAQIPVARTRYAELQQRLGISN
jgi:two-component system, LytTR family, response regulator